MTILESIKDAEAKAEKLRQEATENVEKLLEETKQRCTELTTKLYQEAESKVKALSEETDQKIIDLEKEIYKSYDKNDQEIIAQAQVKKQRAVDFILERIIDL